MKTFLFVLMISFSGTQAIASTKYTCSERDPVTKILIRFQLEISSRSMKYSDENGGKGTFLRKDAVNDPETDTTKFSHSSGGYFSSNMTWVIPNALFELDNSLSSFNCPFYWDQTSEGAVIKSMSLSVPCTIIE